MSELKPCPWCGGTDIRPRSPSMLRWFMQCEECLCCSPEATRQTLAIIAWNTRASASADDVAEAYAALEKLFFSYKRLADSGDAGFWSFEDTVEGKEALAAALAKARTEEPNQ